MKNSGNRIAAVALFVASLWTIAWAADVIHLNKERSRIEFTGSKAGASHHGGFKVFTVDATADWGDLPKSSFKFEIDANSLWSDDGGLTRHLKTPDFFDVARYPIITFETTRIEVKGAQEALVTGTLTMLGKAVELTAPCKIDVTDNGLTVSADFKIDRTLWGMKYGKGRVNEDVDITVKLVFGR